MTQTSIPIEIIKRRMNKHPTNQFDYTTTVNDLEGHFEWQ